VSSTQGLGAYGGYDYTLSTAMAYDSVGRIVTVINPKGDRTYKTYDELGNVLTESDARNIVTHLYSYTGDGLLQCVAEPDMDPATPANSVYSMTDCVPSAGFVVTKQYDYGSRIYPAGLRVANMNTTASTGPRTSYTYDYAGRVLTTTLPDSNTIVQSYDNRGNLLFIKDADGFITQYTYDSMNRMIVEKKPARSTDASHQDVLAGLGAGLQSFYTYDQAGNLTQEIKDSVGNVTKPNHNGLVTNYLYDSRGKVIAESRPIYAGTPTYKLMRYRLDGAKTATTTYDYTGNFRAIVPELTNPPTVTSGNATLYHLDARGYTTVEVSIPTTSPCTLGQSVTIESPIVNFACAEYRKTFTINGAGKIIQRNFDGSGKIYRAFRDTFWHYDQNFNLIESYHLDPRSSIKFDRFTYTYSATNKEIQNTRDISSSLLGSTLHYGATIGSVTTTYNERDLVASVSLNDYGEHALSTVSTANQITNSHINKYYYDGQLRNVDTTASDMLIGGLGGKTFTYDTRGRVVTEEDPDGSKTYGDNDSGDLQTQVFKRETIKTVYGQFGTVTQTVVYGTSASTDCHIVTKTTPTINGLTWKYEEWDTSVGTCGTDGLQSKQNIYTYTPRGQLATNTEVLREDDDGNSATAPIKTTNKYDYAYDVYNNQTSEFLDRTIGTVNNPRKEVQTTYYNGINAVTSMIVRPFSEPIPETITYSLDSLGNRIGVGGSTNTNVNRFYGYSKRYDASGKTYVVYREQILSDLDRNNYIWFRYDPFGHEVFSSSSEDYVKKIYFDGELIRKVLRSTFTTIYSGNDVVFTRVRGNPANPIKAAYVWYDNRTPSDNYAFYDRIKNESFSMADTINAPQWTNIDTLGLEETAGAFEAPVDALSTTLQIEPLEVRPPDAETPTQPTEDAGDVTLGDEEQAESDGETTSEQASSDTETTVEGTTQTSNVDVSVPLPSLNADSLAVPSTGSAGNADAGATLPNANVATPLPATTELDTTTLTTAPLGAPTTLTALPELTDVPAPDTTGDGTTSNEGDSALPESINQVDSSEVTLPETTLPSTFEATNPDEIVSPDDASVPQVGVVASDSPLDVVMPESLTANVPTIGDGTPEAIDTVIPPAEWLKAKDEALIATLAVPGESGGKTRPRAKDNDSQTSNNRNSSQQTTGRKNTPDREKNVRNKEENNSYGKSSTAGARDKAERDARREDRKTPKNKAQAKQDEAVNTANNKGNVGSGRNPLLKGGGNGAAIPAPKGNPGINWGDVGKALGAAGKAIADAAKVIGPAAGRIIGGVVGAVIIGTQAADGELPEYLMTEEDKAANNVPENEENKPRSSLPDDAIVIRGGQNSAGTAEGIKTGTGVTEKDGKVYGVSGRAGPLDGATREEKVKDLVQGNNNPIKSGQIGTTTAGEIRAAGGEPWPDGEGPYADKKPSADGHVYIDGISADALAGLFNDGMEKNPIK
jgi:YD repeat-containing protein